MGIRLDQLPPGLISRAHVLPAMENGQTVRLTVGQILDLIVDAAPDELDTLNKLAAALGNDPNFAATMTTALSGKLDASDARWFSKAIGELYAVDDSMAGADVPPTNDSRFRYIKLTAGLTGSGQYNNGILTTESVSGSAPLVSATAVVNLTGSPVNGRTVRLLNTEGRFLRASTSPGTVQNDQMQQITGTIVAGRANTGFGAFSNGGALVGATLSSGTGGEREYAFDSANSPGARAGNETRSKNIQLTYYMRIK